MQLAFCNALARLKSTPSQNIRCKLLCTKIGGVQCHATGDLLVGGVDVQNAVFTVTDPHNLGHRAVKRCLGCVASLGVQEVPGSGCFGRSPIVLGLGKQCFVLAANQPLHDRLGVFNLHPLRSIDPRFALAQQAFPLL